jgi:Zn-finger nucleic acid-binding protein
VRLVACPACHAQYDVTHVDAPVFDCRCGAAVRNEAGAAADVRIQRCSSCGANLPDGAETCSYCNSAVVRDSRSLPLICPECFARNAETARFCAGCGVAFQPEPMPEEQEDPPVCPNCEGQETMAARSVGGVWVRECAKCNGLWVPGAKLDRLIQRAVDTARERAASGASQPPLRPQAVSARFQYRACPVCHERMYRKNFGKRSGVIVDWCGAHGTWLDKDELEQIAHFVAAGGLRDAGGAAGLSEGGRMSVDQFRALVVGDRMIEQARQREERRGAWAARPSPHRHISSLLDLLGDLLR